MLDHGILNVPLSKRGNIDTQLDKYKAEQAAVKKNKMDVIKADFKDDKAVAKELWSQVDKALIKAWAKKRGVLFSEVKETLDELVKWQPKKAIKVLPMFIKS